MGDYAWWEVSPESLAWQFWLDNILKWWSGALFHPYKSLKGAKTLHGSYKEENINKQVNSRHIKQLV